MFTAAPAAGCRRWYLSAPARVDLLLRVRWQAFGDADMCEVSIPEHSKKRWCRAPAPALDAKKDAITFQQMDTDYYIAVRPHGAPRQVLRHYVHEGAWRRARARGPSP